MANTLTGMHEYQRSGRTNQSFSTMQVTIKSEPKVEEIQEEPEIFVKSELDDYAYAWQNSPEELILSCSPVYFKDEPDDSEESARNASHEYFLSESAVIKQESEIQTTDAAQESVPIDAAVIRSELLRIWPDAHQLQSLGSGSCNDVNEKPANNVLNSGLNPNVRTPGSSQGVVQGQNIGSASIVKSRQERRLAPKPPPPLPTPPQQNLLQLPLVPGQLGQVVVQPPMPTVMLLPTMHCGLQYFIVSPSTNSSPMVNTSPVVNPSQLVNPSPVVKPLPDLLKVYEDKGRFGWTVLQDARIPFIVREEKKFIALRAIENTYLREGLRSLPAYAYSTTYVRAFFVNTEEAILLSEINAIGCNWKFGRKDFSREDAVLQLEEARTLLEFLTMCHVKLNHLAPVAGNEKDASFGLLQINGVATPYVKRSEEKYVPLSLCNIDAALKSSWQTTVKRGVQGWELACLNFCAMVAGVKCEPALQNSSALVAAQDVAQAMGVEVPFEEWWPAALPCTTEVATGPVTPVSFWAKRRQGGLYISDKCGLKKLSPGASARYPSMLYYFKFVAYCAPIKVDKTWSLAMKPQKLLAPKPVQADVVEAANGQLASPNIPDVQCIGEKFGPNYCAPLVPPMPMTIRESNALQKEYRRRARVARKVERQRAVTEARRAIYAARCNDTFSQRYRILESEVPPAPASLNFGNPAKSGIYSPGQYMLLPKTSQS